MPSLSELTKLEPKVLQNTLKLEPRHHYGPDEPDSLVFMSPTVALKDAELRHGGKDDLGAKECLSRVTRKILESKDASLFVVPEVTATHLGYGKKSKNKEGREAITKEEGELWLEMLDFRRFKNVPKSEDSDLTPEHVQDHLSGLKIEEKGRFHLFFSILLIVNFDKNHRDERKAAVGPNKISDFLIFWTLPFLLNFSHRKVQEIIKHGRRKNAEYSVNTVKVCAENVIEKACVQMVDRGENLLAVFKDILKGSRPLKEQYELLADTAGCPIIFVPMEYQVTKMPAHIKDLGSKATWDKLVDATPLKQFLELFVDDIEIQKDFFYALRGLEDRQGIDYAIIFPDVSTFKDFVQVIQAIKPDSFAEQARPIVSCGKASASGWRAVVKGNKTNFTVCFSYLQGFDNASIARVFRAIGSHHRNHFTVIILNGKVCNPKDPYQCGNLHPVSKAMKFVMRAGKLVKVTKVTKKKERTLKYPLECEGGRGFFSEIDFPVNYLKWEEAVKADPIVAKKNLQPQYKSDEPLCVGFSSKKTSPKWVPADLAHTAEDLVQTHEYRVFSQNTDGCVIANVARSARKHGHALIMALSGYRDNHKCTFASKPEVMRTIICHFVRGIMFAGLPAVFHTVPDKTNHDVEMGSEDEEDEPEDDDKEEDEDEEYKKDFGYHSETSASHNSSFHQEHKDVLQKFVSEVKKDIHNGVKSVGYVKKTYSALGDGFLRNLLEYGKSVGIIKSKHADGRQSSAGTVFRVGSHFVLTNQHVVQGITECAGGVEYLGNRGSVFVSFNYCTPDQHGEPLVELFLHPQCPIVWENGLLDAAVLQLDTQRMPFNYQLPAPLGHLHADTSRSTTLYIIGREARGEHNRCLDPQCPVMKFEDLPPGFLEENRDIVFALSDPRRTLLSSSFTHGASGSPGFDEHGCLVVMYTRGYPDGRSQVEQAVNIVEIKEQMRSESPQFAELAEHLFPLRSC